MSGFIPTAGAFAVQADPLPDLFPWYAVRVRANFEKTTASILGTKGYSEFVPLYRARRAWSDRVKVLDAPLFPGYVFCRFDINNRLPILITPGVVNIVGFGGIPAAVDEAEIAAIQGVMRSGAPAEPWPFLREGQPVVIARGALRGVSGHLVSIKNQHRLVVSVTLLQRSMAVAVDRDCVDPIL